jgi:restriction system protein
MLPAVFAKYHEEQKGKKKTTEEMASLSGVDFETAVGRILLEHGWHVSATAATGDQGADIIATKGERRVIIQAKRYSGAVGNKAVQEVVGAIPFYGGTEGCVVTNSTFTPAASALAQKNNIRLIDGSRFEEIAEL